MEGSVKEINKVKEDLRKEGIIPVNLFIGEGDSKTEKSIYPYAIFHFGKRVYVVNLLEAQVSGVPQEETLNNSVALLEYKFANAIQKNIGTGVGYANMQDSRRAIRFVETKPNRWRIQIRINGQVVVESEPLFQDALITMLLQDTSEVLEAVA